MFNIEKTLFCLVTGKPLLRIIEKEVTLNVLQHLFCSYELKILLHIFYSYELRIL